jgi:hypothetical protein
LECTCDRIGSTAGVRKLESSSFGFAAPMCIEIWSPNREGAAERLRRVLQYDSKVIQAILHWRTSTATRYVHSAKLGHVSPAAKRTSERRGYSAFLPSCNHSSNDRTVGNSFLMAARSAE